MKDQRVTSFRKALEALVDSLDATARLSRWNTAESAPRPLHESAAKLGEHLGAASRLAQGTFVGATPAIASLTGMSGAVQRLQAAYQSYRHQIEEQPTERDTAAMALDAEIVNVKAELENWT
jgi:hypothetical protein